MLKTVFVLGTFMPLHIGHEQLLRFAVKIASQQESPTRVNVLINTRDCEPIPSHVREWALHQLMERLDRENSTKYKSVVSCYHGDVPQNPSEADSEEMFWEIWKFLLLKNTLVRPGDIIVGSETYCIKLAEVMRCTFLPYDVGRNTNQISATEIRKNPYNHFSKIVPEARSFFQTKVTLFGAESTGKSSMTARLASRIFPNVVVTEWARPYLEMCGTELTQDKMNAIEKGQYAVQCCAASNPEAMFIFQDTDLISTFGYHKIFNSVPGKWLYYNMVETISDLYVVMNDQIPFEKDPIRYGGDVRQSNTDFWVDLLQEFGCNYMVVKSVDPREQFDEITTAIDDLIAPKFNKLAEFQRT
jgi:NadR type nicotinamide-nucleotide adenylyltransferase